MENKDNDAPLMKSRGISGTIVAGSRLFAGSFSSLFSYTWQTVLAAAILSAIIPLSFAGSPRLTLPAVILALLAFIVVYGHLASFLSHHAADGVIVKKKAWHDFLPMSLRFLKGGLSLLIIIAVPAAAVSVVIYRLSSGFNSAYMIGFTALLTLILLPLLYCLMRYLFTEEKFWSSLIGNLRKGYRRWGYIFCVVFVVNIITCFIGLVISVPTYILVIAQTISALGVTALGDPAGLPSFFPPLLFIMTALTTFISVYLSAYSFFIYYYMYGSISQRDRERETFKSEQNDYKLKNRP